MQEDSVFIKLTCLFNKKTIYTDAETAINTKATCMQISLCVFQSLSNLLSATYVLPPGFPQIAVLSYLYLFSQPKELYVI